MSGESVLLVAAIFALALLYSSVGHGGASGYLAAMALVGMSHEEMRPTALVLNVAVAGIATLRFARAGHFSWSTLWPFLVAAVPAAAIAGRLFPPGYVFKPLVGLVLLYAGWRFIARYWQQSFREQETPAAELRGTVPPLVLALPIGAGLGFLAGLTGTGGGIFLSPLLLFMGWADPQRTAGVAAAFVLTNSAAGLAGWSWGQAFALPEGAGVLSALPGALPLFLVAAVAGGSLGSGLGARRLGGETIRALLGVVLVIAAVKLLVTGWQDLQIALGAPL
jgi:uncharacterized protein